MSASPPYNDILGDDSLAPLKRNHACLQCKKRKVKCDATRPTCAPCMRSHAHALRTAQRNKTAPPPLVCTYTDIDSPFDSDHIEESLDIPAPHSAPRPSLGNETRRKTTEGFKKSVKGAFAGKGLEREKDLRRDEEKETLLARIAELEARLTVLTPSDSNSSQSNPVGKHVFNPPSYEQFDPFTSYNPSPEINAANVAYMDQRGNSEPPLFGTNIGQNNTNGNQAWVDDIINGTTAQAQQAGQEAGKTDFDFGSFMMLPAFWPQSLPPPFLLEHLVETFFTHVPQLPRLLHRPSLLARLRLPPNSPDFPHPALLHAICAHASTYTAWVNSIAPEHLEAAVEREKELHGSLDAISDFGIAQGEAAQRSIRLYTAVCMFGGGQAVVDITQASLILADMYFLKGMLTAAWLISGNAARLIKALEVLNKNKPKRFKEPLAADPADDFQREERLALAWLAFVMDSGMCMNAFWSGSFDLAEMKCRLPASSEYFKGALNDIPENPQTAHAHDVLTTHPVADSFVLVVKASTLIARATAWIREWNQRDMVEGDDMDGMSRPSFLALIDDIHKFQSSVPNAIRSLYKTTETTSANTFDPNILLVHMLPNIAFFLLYEPFVDWHAQSSHALTQVQRGYEAVLCVLHLIPSNLDVTLILTFNSIFCLYTLGRVIANFVHRSSALQQFDMAVKHRGDLSSVQILLNRYGQKHLLGQMLSKFLDAYVSLDPGNSAYQDKCIEAAKPPQFRTGSSFAPDESPQSAGPSSSTTCSSTNGSMTSASPVTYTPPGHTVNVPPVTMAGCMKPLGSKQASAGDAGYGSISSGSGRGSSASTPASQMNDFISTSSNGLNPTALAFNIGDPSSFGIPGVNNNGSYGAYMLGGDLDSSMQIPTNADMDISMFGPNQKSNTNNGLHLASVTTQFESIQSTSIPKSQSDLQNQNKRQSRYTIGAQTSNEYDTETCGQYATDASQIVWAGS